MLGRRASNAWAGALGASGLCFVGGQSDQALFEKGVLDGEVVLVGVFGAARQGLGFDPAKAVGEDASVGVDALKFIAFAAKSSLAKGFGECFGFDARRAEERARLMGEGFASAQELDPKGLLGVGVGEGPKELGHFLFVFANARGFKKRSAQGQGREFLVMLVAGEGFGSVEAKPIVQSLVGIGGKQAG